MGKAISDEELQLKKRARRRLVGAIALVLLIVVFLPMVLDNEPRPLSQDIAITIPPVPKPDSPPSIPAPAQSAPPPSIPQQGAPQAASASPSPTVAGMPTGAPASGTQNLAAADGFAGKPEKSRADAKSPARSAQKTDAAAAAPAGEEAFVVQLGAFSNAANAKALQKKLRDNKFKAYTEPVKSAGGERVRVRVGPYASREAAEKARERLKSMKLVIGEAAVVRRD